jgi:hypothetical protein
MPLYLVETVTMFKHQYVIDAFESEHANDTVVMNEAEELHQDYLTETIVSTREITNKEFKNLCKDAINGHLGDRMINVVDYKNNTVSRPDHSSNVDSLGI